MQMSHRAANAKSRIDRQPIAGDNRPQELHALATEIREIVESEQLGGRIADVNDKATAFVNTTSAQAQSLADALTWRVGGLMLFAFALALVYRTIAVRVLAKKRIAAS